MKKTKLVKQIEKQILLDMKLYASVLEKFAWDRERACKYLGMSRATFYRKIGELGLTKLSIQEWRKL